MDSQYMQLVSGLVVLGCIGLFFGIGLGLAAHKFAVEVNSKVEAVKGSPGGRPMRGLRLCRMRGLCRSRGQ